MLLGEGRKNKTQSTPHKGKNRGVNISTTEELQNNRKRPTDLNGKVTGEPPFIAFGQKETTEYTAEPTTKDKEDAYSKQADRFKWLAPKRCAFYSFRLYRKTQQKTETIRKREQRKQQKSTS